MVQNVERFHAELKRHLFPKHEGPRKRQVELHFTRPSYVVVTQVAVRPQMRGLVNAVGARHWTQGAGEHAG